MRFGAATLANAIWSLFPVASRTVSVVKSLQRGTITVADGVASDTATITSVTTSKSVILWSGYDDNDNSAPSNPKSWAFKVVLTNSTTVTASRNGANNGAITMAYQVLEFY